jgi:hypothetical protein
VRDIHHQEVLPLAARLKPSEFADRRRAHGEFTRLQPVPVFGWWDDSLPIPISAGDRRASLGGNGGADFDSDVPLSQLVWMRRTIELSAVHVDDRRGVQAIARGATI